MQIRPNDEVKAKKAENSFWKWINWEYDLQGNSWDKTIDDANESLGIRVFFLASIDVSRDFAINLEISPDAIKGCCRLVFNDLTLSWRDNLRPPNYTQLLKSDFQVIVIFFPRYYTSLIFFHNRPYKVLTTKTNFPIFKFSKSSAISVSRKIEVILQLFLLHRREKCMTTYKYGYREIG